MKTLETQTELSLTNKIQKMQERISSSEDKLEEIDTTVKEIYQKKFGTSKESVTL